MASPLDLRQLAVERTAPTIAIGTRKRKFWTRYGVPLVVLLGFAAVVGWSLRDRFLPKRAVTVIPIVLTQAEVQQAGTPLFQAAGWIEPRPSAVLVSALVEGIVEAIFVVEGQAVEKGEPIAKLVDADARLALADAEASVKLREAELALAQASLTAAKVQFNQPLQLQAALAEAEATLAKLQTEIKNLPFALRSEKSRRLLAEQNLEGKQRAGDNIAVRLLQQAQSEANSAAAAVEQLEQRGPSLQAESSAWERRCDALRTQLSLKAEETRKGGGVGSKRTSRRCEAETSDDRGGSGNAAIEPHDCAFADYGARLSARIQARATADGTFAGVGTRLRSNCDVVRSADAPGSCGRPP